MYASHLEKNIVALNSSKTTTLSIQYQSTFSLIRLFPLRIWTSQGSRIILQSQCLWKRSHTSPGTSACVLSSWLLTMAHLLSTLLINTGLTLDLYTCTSSRVCWTWQYGPQSSRCKGWWLALTAGYWVSWSMQLTGAGILQLLPDRWRCSVQVSCSFFYIWPKNWVVYNNQFCLMSWHFPLFELR